MTASQLARLAAIEVAVCADRRKAEIARRPSHLLTDAECVQCIYDLCHSGPRGCADSPRSPAQEAEVLRLRALIREQSSARFSIALLRRSTSPSGRIGRRATS